MTRLAVGRTRAWCEMHCSATAASSATAAAGHAPDRASTYCCISENSSGSSQCSAATSNARLARQQLDEGHGK